MTTTLEQPRTKTGSSRVLRALSTTLVATLSDAFDLTLEERLFLGMRLDSTLSVLEPYEIRAVPLGVSEEIRTGIYSKRLVALSERTATPLAAVAEVRSASLEQWSAVISEQIRMLTGDQLDAVDAARVDALLVSTLEDIGVGSEHLGTYRARCAIT